VRFQQLSIELLSMVYDWDIGMAASATRPEGRSEGEQASALSRQDRRLSGDTPLEMCMK
jgi:hypothetical protein